MNAKWAFIISITLFTCGGIKAAPRTWSELSGCLVREISYQGKLKPDFARNVERFFSRYINDEQLLHIEKRNWNSDTFFNFLSYDSHAVMKRLTRRDKDQGKRLQLALEHMFYQALLRFKEIRYSDLCRVLFASLQGGFNVMNTLTDNGLLAARGRFIYFLIERVHADYNLSSQSVGQLPSLQEITREALGGREVMLAMQRELGELNIPLVDSWEEIEFFDDFFDREMSRQRWRDFLAQVMEITKNLPLVGMSQYRSQ